MKNSSTSSLTKSRTLVLAVIIAGALVAGFALFTGSAAQPSRSVNQDHIHQLAPPVPTPPAHLCWYGKMCADVVTGTYSYIWGITSSSGGLDDIKEYHAATFDQEILSSSDTSVTVKVTSQGVLNTNAGFPLDTAQLPADVQPYLQPTSSQQSDNPIIIEQAQVLVENAHTEAQAVVAILDWVRANITYDSTFSLPNDAVSVYQNRSGVCAGFSNLAVALLRAVGIPAKDQVGCALWSQPHGGGHAWIEVYYPDVGWVPSEPQGQENFALPNRLVASRWWDWCGKSSTTVTHTQYADGATLYTLATSYGDDIWHIVDSASVPSWDRKPPQVEPDELAFLLQPDNVGVRQLSLEVNDNRCVEDPGWVAEASVPWITMTPSSGITYTVVTVSADATGLSPGVYTGTIVVRTTGWDVFSRIVPVQLLVAEQVHTVYLPLVLRNH